MNDRPAEHAIRAALLDSAADLLTYFERRVGLDDAPDLLGDLMATAWRRASSLPPSPEEARMWLFGIARHTLNNATRTERRHSHLLQRLRDITTRTVAPASDVGLEVRDAVGRLNEDDAELIRLVHWDGFSIEAAAELIGTPASTARSRYQRAKATLRAALSPSVGE
ncbi:RNA polymerase sigma factor [Clavibacter michiganensis subsp. phaseoli]|uniref:RNA polymerase sigma factor n=1 Tax=Clavibacter phaseoli TaxID=1734031 RepID=A0A8I0SDN3_9MICO|nr:RNA polymerase sigma factor [Clavibacter phaseoli]MBF4632735.1 RNA polymerase sigma factor [Clavibacter phaseoli]